MRVATASNKTYALNGALSVLVALKVNKAVTKRVAVVVGLHFARHDAAKRFERVIQLLIADRLGCEMGNIGI